MKKQSWEWQKKAACRLAQAVIAGKVAVEDLPEKMAELERDFPGSGWDREASEALIQLMKRRSDGL